MENIEANLVVMISKLALTTEAQDLFTHREYQETESWLKSFTLENNFKAIICETEDSGVEAIRSIVKSMLMLRFSDPKVFECFEFSMRVHEIDNNEFWLNSSYSPHQSYPVAE